MTDMEDVEQYRLSEERRQEIFDTAIVPIIFEAIKPAERPVAVFVGGQPGAGKSSTQNHVQRELRAEDAHSVLGISGDDLRAFHPDYANLLQLDDRSAAMLTDYDSGKWVEMVINHSASIGCSVVIEGTFRTPQVPIQTAEIYNSMVIEPNLTSLLPMNC